MFAGGLTYVVEEFPHNTAITDNSGMLEDPVQYFGVTDLDQGNNMVGLDSVNVDEIRF